VTTSATPAGHEVWARLARARRRVDDAWARVPARLRTTKAFLAALVGVQWVAVAVFAATVRHNGWLFYQGGDELWQYTTGWLVAHGHLPTTPIGYGWSVLLVPVAWIAGPNLVSALPAIVLLNVLVLAPVALFCIYGIATRIGGRAIGALAAVAWVAAPYAVIPLWQQGYHAKYVEQFLPQALGLTALADYPGMVAVIVAAYFCVRVVDSGQWLDALLAGVAAGTAIALKPSTSLFLVAPAATFLVARRWRSLLPLAVGVAPAVLLLTLWKERGLGYVPAFNAEAHRVAAAGDRPLVAGGILDPFHRYIHLDWGQLNNNRLGFREHFYSERLVEWLPLAGVIAVARRRPVLSLFLGVWFAVFVVAKGTFQYATVESGSFFRFLMPAWPPFLLMVASLPLLVPGATRRIRERRRATVPARPSRRTVVAVLSAVGLLYVLLPLVAIAAARPLKSSSPPAVEFEGTLIPESPRLALSAHVARGGVALSWPQSRPRAAGVFFRVLRGRIADAADCSPARGATTCTVALPIVATTRGSAYVDHPARGRWAYRIGLSGNWLDDPAYGDVLLVSPPVAVRVR
jgi:hypothetical protein